VLLLLGADVGAAGVLLMLLPHHFGLQDGSTHANQTQKRRESLRAGGLPSLLQLLVWG
jgi:hypothetical protein